MSYINADGLSVITFADQGKVKTNGVAVHGERKQLIVTLNGTDIESSAGVPVPEDAYIPAGAVVTGAWTVVKEAFTSGGAATLDIGFYTAAGATIDADGVDAAVALTALNTIGKVVKNDGALINGATTIGAANAYVVPVYGTAAYTAGKAKLVIEYFTV